MRSREQAKFMVKSILVNPHRLNAARIICFRAIRHAAIGSPTCRTRSTPPASSASLKSQIASGVIVVTNARFATFHGLPVGPVPPLDHARSTPQTAPSSRTESFQRRKSGGLPSAARRRRSAPVPFPPSLRLRSTLSALRPQTEASSKSS